MNHKRRNAASQPVRVCSWDLTSIFHGEPDDLAESSGRTSILVPVLVLRGDPSTCRLFLCISGLLSKRSLGSDHIS